MRYNREALIIVLCIIGHILCDGNVWPRFNKDNQNTAYVSFPFNMDTAPTVAWTTSISSGFINAAVIGHNASEIFVTSNFPFTLSVVSLSNGTLLRSRVFPIDTGSPPAYHFLSATNQGYVVVTCGLNATAFDTQLNQMWVFQSPTQPAFTTFAGSPLISSENVVYLVTKQPQGTLFAVDLEHGTYYWSMVLDPVALWDSPALTHDARMLIVPNRNGSLYCVNTVARLVEWRFDAHDSMTAATIYEPPLDSSLSLWNRMTRSASALSPIVYAGSMDENVYALDLETGNMLWKYNTGGWLVEMVVGVDINVGVVYAGSHNGQLTVINPDGTKLWTAARTQAAFSPTIDSLGSVIVPSNDGTIAAYDVSGTLLWSLQLGQGFVQVAPIVSPDLDVIVCAKGMLLKLQAPAVPPILSLSDIVAVTLGGGVLFGILIAVSCICYRNRRPKYYTRSSVDDSMEES